MEKTALQELKENIDYLYLETKSDTEFKKGFVSCLEHVFNFIEAKKLLKKEKQKIIDAYKNGTLADYNPDYDTGEKYFSETFEPPPNN